MKSLLSARRFLWCGASAILLSTLPGILCSAPLSVDLSSREPSRQFYRAVYGASEGVPMGFTGDVVAGNAGDTSAAFKDAVRLRVNFFRTFAGLPGEIAFTSTYNSKCQQAALVGAANNTIAHAPPTSARFYSTTAAEACGKSNLALIDFGPEAITAYMRDALNNSHVGHRRWILYPQTREMGTGDVPAAATFSAANALWILDSNAGGPRPATRTAYVAWPPAGYVPHPLVFPRWSISVAGADFSQAYVSVRRNGETVPVAVENLTNGFGENTLVWVLDRQSATAVASHSRPADDVTYAVEVTNVVAAGGAQSYRYNVIVYDPDVAGRDATPVTLSGPATPFVGSANSYAISAPAFLNRLQWRTLRSRSAPVRFDAEGTPGLAGMIANISNYDPVVSDSRAGGAAAYRLVHPTPLVAEQTLTLPDTYLATDSNAVLSFASRLGYATARQSANVQTSTDDGISWSNVYQKTGTGSSGDREFSTITVPLSRLAQRTFRVRFNYKFVNGGSAFNQTDPDVGWYFDNIELTGVRIATVGTVTDANGTSAAFTPTEGTEISLQARGYVSSYPAEWGPVITAFSGVTTTPVATGGGPDPAVALPAPAGSGARLVNLSVRTTAGSDAAALMVGFNLSGTGTKPVLLRAIGPTLGVFGVSGAMTDPLMRLATAAGVAVQQNDNWAGATPVTSAASRVGAFALDPASLDAAILPSLSAGSYTAQVTPASAGVAPGSVLVEVYDAESAGGSRLANISARAPVGTGADILILGFAISGSGNRNVLIRAVGPTLGAFGVADVLADPKLELFRGETLVRSSDNWNGTLAPAFASVGAFALTPNSRDAALALALAPGSYTAQVSGVGATTGFVLVEIYELP